MIDIISSANGFTINNGTLNPRTYKIEQGNKFNEIRISNVYRENDLILKSTPISEITVDGSAPYADISLLSEVLTPILFTRGGGNGSGVPTQDHIFENAAARDAHFTTNLSELRTGTPIFVGGVDLGGGQFGTQLQEWGGVNDPLTYDNTDWVSGGIIGLTGAQIKVLYESNADTNAFTDTLLTKLNAARLYPALTETVDALVSTKSIVTPDNSIFLGNLRLSNGSFSINVEELGSGRQFFPVAYELLDAGTNRPYQWSLGGVINTPSAAGKSETLTGTEVQFRAINVINGVANAYVFDSNVLTEDVNLQVRVNSHTNPTPTFDWKRATGGEGFTLPMGENTLTLPIPQFFEAGLELFVTVSSPNQISLKGETLSVPLSGGGVQNEGVPYIETVGRQAIRRDIAYLSDIVVNPPISPSGMFTSFSIDGQSTSVTTPFTLSGNQTFNFSINNPSLFTGNLTILQGDAVLLDTISTTSTSSIISVTSSTLSNVGDNEVFTIRGTNTDGTVVSRTFTIHASGSGQLVYYGLSATDNPASVDLSTLQSIAVGTGVIDINTGVVTDGQYFIILDPSNNAIVSITDDVLQQDVTEFFTMTPTVRSIDSINYNSYVIGPLNADAEGETYTLMLR